ncbi:MAG: hypothetical protein A3I05_06455 [Deltaproteobacteria bacterium RIFCSPLOWO2_02_FULL_44_10]|nr:MAG: hypothetical protein A3C46_06660 [Deltaproteobacteria bacterium RIFCSPHIGHO2_02_FULL_44_16]OGQ46680.1 MAG: hypothetical protein A3I05_06455 [Deltaproteobacteria bacterium RIFCSPLOWO2_02_FULL_44_10]
MDKVLIDTSVWIDFFRGSLSTTFLAHFTETLTAQKGVITDLIRHEILVGAQDKKRFQDLQELLSPLTCYRIQSDELFQFDVFAWELRKKGFKGKYTDASIAFIAHRYHVPLITFDRYFQLVEKFGLIELVKY